MRPQRDTLMGSGVRAAGVMRFSDDVRVTLRTRAKRKDEETIRKKIGNAALAREDTAQTIAFDYVTPLSVPVISPRVDTIDSVPVRVEAGNALVFGMLDCDVNVQADRVVFDPQSPAAPKFFKANGSRARELVVVLNEAEARRLAGENDLEAAAKMILSKDDAAAVVVKRGFRGADVYVSGGACHHVSAFETAMVFPIGSGDVFSAALAYQSLVKGSDLVRSVEFAARTVAKYFDNGGFLDIAIDEMSEHKPLEFRGGIVYLAGPFFSVPEEWMVSEVRRWLMGSGLEVKSPLHDVGRGGDEVAAKDLAMLDECDRVFAILDNIDPGTVYEIGYAQKAGIPVVGVYTAGKPGDRSSRLETPDERLKMVVGDAKNTYVYADLAAALAKVCCVSKA
ncbi:MAG TPA: PfkB family carbohydrate kinase [Candidatus Eremiobacteraceae bacterium]|nr:PfkB family carbohydrate kinase [Candidatus Eremiobacteraceae bacterium]